MLPVHPLADVFPLMAGAALADLTADVAINGLLHPVTLLDGAVLDGRSRLTACRTANVEPRFVNFTGRDPAPFIVVVNVSQRHLDISQRAMVAAKLSQLADSGVRPPDQTADCRVEHVVSPLMTIARAASLLNVSRSTVENARAVHCHGARELVAEVELGVISVFAAVDLSRLPVEIQLVVADDPSSSSAVAKAIRMRDPAVLVVCPGATRSTLVDAVSKLLSTSTRQQGSDARGPVTGNARARDVRHLQ